jgi:hypothetical protein
VERAGAPVSKDGLIEAAPDSLDAYDPVLRAFPHVYVATSEEAAKAVPLLEQAFAVYYWMTPQAMRPPASPAGSLL